MYKTIKQPILIDDQVLILDSVVFKYSDIVILNSYSISILPDKLCTLL